MKQYPTSAFSIEVWREIYGIFWRERIPCLPSDVTPDGIDPVAIETTKRGVEITGMMSFLESKSCPLRLCLSRPVFSSVESVSVAKLRASTISDASLEGKRLSVSISANLDKRDEE
ncbi:hypothetical protein [Prosthecobacter sp.]|uniref:hypothetical protein n=1 Tax=Prosthecobacter sp. TaxID=1965333 RepID=UPI0037831D27